MIKKIYKLRYLPLFSEDMEVRRFLYAGENRADRI